MRFGWKCVARYYDVDAARQQIEVARAAIAESQESLRINQDRYDSGFSTISDLLAAEEAARRSQTDYWEAVYRYHTGYANLELAERNFKSSISRGDAMNRRNHVHRIDSYSHCRFRRRHGGMFERAASPNPQRRKQSVMSPSSSFTRRPCPTGWKPWEPCVPRRRARWPAR